MKNRLILVAILTLAFVSPAVRAQPFIEQNTRIAFDAGNFLVFEDVGRITYFNPEGKRSGMRAGRFIRLHATRDGKQSDIDLIDATSKTLVNTQVEAIRYADRDNIWLIGRAGHLGDYAMLYNLPGRSPKLHLGGDRFQLSPDARLITCSTIVSHIYRGEPEQFIVMLNDVSIYPEIKTGILNLPYPAKSSDGDPRIAALAGAGVRGRTIPDIHWAAPDALEFSMTEQVDATLEATTHTRTALYRVTGISEKSLKLDASRMKLTRISVVPIPPSAQ